MKIYYLLLTILAFMVSAKAQMSIKDSLYQIVKLNKNDTSTINALLDYGDLIAYENRNDAKICYENALKKSIELAFWKGQANTYRCLSFFYGVNINDKEAGLEYAHIFMREAISRNDEKYIGSAYFAFAAVYQQANELDSSVYYYEKAAPLIEKTQPINLSVVYNNIAGIYDHLHLVEKALEYATKAIKLYEIQKDTNGMISSYIHFGNIYSWDKKYLLQQIEAWQNGIRYAKLINCNNCLSILYNNISSCKHDDFEEYDSAIYYSQKALQYISEDAPLQDQVELRIALAKHYASGKKYTKALETLNQVIKDTSKVAISLNKQLLLLETKFLCYRGSQNFKEATAITTSMLEMRDSIDAQNSREVALGFDEKLQRANQAKLLSEKELKITKQQSMLRMFFLTGIALTLILIFLVLFFRKRQIAQRLKIKSVEKENELHAIKSNLEGQLQERSRISKEIHDELGSSLTSISLLTEVLKKRIDTDANPEVNKISATSADMVDKMNEIIWALNTSNDTINSLIAYVRKFSNNFLEEAGIHLKFEEPLIPETLAIEGTVRRNIYLTVKEAINNIVKHAGATHVHVVVNIQDGLHIDIQDDGKGIAFDALPTFRNGLTNMQKRMQDIGGTLTIESAKGTMVKLFYPFKNIA